MISIALRRLTVHWGPICCQWNHCNSAKNQIHFARGQLLIGENKLLKIRKKWSFLNEDQLKLKKLLYFLHLKEVPAVIKALSAHWGFWQSFDKKKQLFFNSIISSFFHTCCCKKTEKNQQLWPWKMLLCAATNLMTKIKFKNWKLETLVKCCVQKLHFSTFISWLFFSLGVAVGRVLEPVQPANRKTSSFIPLWIWVGNI